MDDSHKQAQAPTHIARSCALAANTGLSKGPNLIILPYIYKIFQKKKKEERRKKIQKQL